jgi:hypothetical protein
LIQNGGVALFLKINAQVYIGICSPIKPIQTILDDKLGNQTSGNLIHIDIVCYATVNPGWSIDDGITHFSPKAAIVRDVPIVKWVTHANVNAVIEGGVLDRLDIRRL